MSLCSELMSLMVLVCIRLRTFSIKLTLILKAKMSIKHRSMISIRQTGSKLTGVFCLITMLALIEHLVSSDHRSLIRRKRLNKPVMNFNLRERCANFFQWLFSAGT